jgi:hypothetical protein
MEQENDILRTESERMEMKLDSLEKAYLTESTNVCLFNESDEKLVKDTLDYKKEKVSVLIVNFEYKCIMLLS